jgi:DNA primase
MSTVDEVKQRLDIVDVVGQHAALQKAGRNFRALCPFHSERAPSFYVFPDRQTWHCFGACSTGGDVISFVMKKEGLEFRAALEMLAQRAGVALPAPAGEQADPRREAFRSANEEAARFFHHALLESSEGTRALEYVAGRGLDQDTIAAFQLGYAPDSWDGLKRHLSGLGFEERDLLAAGLLVEGERGPYDRFRGRLTFPIRDERGRAAGFGARALDDSLPKYLNTSQTPIFDKGGMLYALDRAREHIRKSGQAVIVEGYMDAITAHQHGLGNVVASMGTAMTDRQVKLLTRYTRNLVLALDADAAGAMATLRGANVATEEKDTIGVPRPGDWGQAARLTEQHWRGFIRQQEVTSNEIRVITLPSGTDPDEVIRGDPEEWRRLIATAKPVADHLFEALAARLKGVSNPLERAQAAKELAPVLEGLSDPVAQATYVQRLARALELDTAGEEAVLRSLRRRSRRPSSGRTELVEESGTEGTLRPAAREPREEYLLALLLRHPTLREKGASLASDLFSMSENRQLFEAWRGASASEEVRRLLPEELQGHLENVSARRVPPFQAGEAEKALEDCVWRLEQRKLELEKLASSLALAESEEEVGPARLAELARSVQEGTLPPGQEPDSAVDAAAILVKDTEAGIEVHRRPLERARKRAGEQPAKEG